MKNGGISPPCGTKGLTRLPEGGLGPAGAGGCRGPPYPRGPRLPQPASNPAPQALAREWGARRCLPFGGLSSLPKTRASVRLRMARPSLLRLGPRTERPVGPAGPRRAAFALLARLRASQPTALHPTVAAVPRRYLFRHFVEMGEISWVDGTLPRAVCSPVQCVSPLTY